MDTQFRTPRFWWFQLVFWGLAGTLLFVSGAKQMPFLQALVRNLFLLFAGFLSSFFLAILIDELRWLATLRLRIVSYLCAYIIALLCVVAINAITFTMRGVELGDISGSQWFSGTLNLALVYAFWAELFIQQVYILPEAAPARPAPDKLVLEHAGAMVQVPVDEVDAIIGAGDYVEVCTAERKYLYRQTLQALEDMLGQAQFVRVHRSRLVNGNRVSSVAPLGKGRYQIRLAGGQAVNSSRGYSDAVRSAFLAAES